MKITTVFTVVRRNNMEIVLYSTHCPRCNVLETKLREKNIEFIEETDVQKMLSLGIESAPALGVDGRILDFKEATNWIKVWDIKETLPECGSCEVKA